MLQNLPTGTTHSDDMDVTEILQSYSEADMQENRINRANAQLVFSPKFIPFYPELFKFGLSNTEILIFGFIDFYMSNSTGRFYFTNEQIAQIVGCAVDTASRAISKLHKLQLLKITRKIRAGGGSIRFITKVYQIPRLDKNYKSDSTKTTNQTRQKLQTNNNKIKENKIKTNPKGLGKPDPRNPDVTEIVSYMEKTLGHKLDDTETWNRRYAFNLIRKLKQEYPQQDPVQAAKVLIDVGSRDKFHSKNVTTVKYVYQNMHKIIRSYKSGNLFVNLD
jgi:predicted transcriptional regulator